MLELSELILKRGCTIHINKKNEVSKLQGTYCKYSSTGLRPYELPEEELRPLINFPNIMERMNKGELLQVTMPAYSFEGVIGKRKTESPYSGTSYLEVHGEATSSNYYKLLVDLDRQLSNVKKNEATQGDNQYKKLYKGGNKYE